MRKQCQCDSQLQPERGRIVLHQHHSQPVQTFSGQYSAGGLQTSSKLCLIHTLSLKRIRHPTALLQTKTTSTRTRTSSSTTRMLLPLQTFMSTQVARLVLWVRRILLKTTIPSKRRGNVSMGCFMSRTKPRLWRIRRTKQGKRSKDEACSPARV